MPPKIARCNQACMRDFGGIKCMRRTYDKTKEENKSKTGGLVSLYQQGYRLCIACECFFDIYNKNCPCCGQLMRVKPRNSKSRQANNKVRVREIES